MYIYRSVLLFFVCILPSDLSSMLTLMQHIWEATLIPQSSVSCSESRVSLAIWALVYLTFCNAAHASFFYSTLFITCCQLTGIVNKINSVIDAHSKLCLLTAPLICDACDVHPTLLSLVHQASSNEKYLV